MFSVTLSKKLLLAQLVTLLFLLALPTASSLNVGDELCIQGFIMDYFCIQNVRMIDNGLVTLEEPERHTVHCLVDVGICLDSAFEVLVESLGSTSYSRGYRLDDGSKSDMIDIARSVGSCSTCANGYDNSRLNRGFKAVMKVIVLDLNPDNGQDAPPLVRVNDQKDSSNLGNDPCQSEYDMEEGIAVSAPTNRPTDNPTPPPTSPPTPNPTRPPTPPPAPTRNPTPNSTRPPTPNPTPKPAPGPTVQPSPDTTPLPTPRPTQGATTATSNAPSLRPSAPATGSPTMVIVSPTMTPNTVAASSTMAPTITTGGGNSTTPEPADSAVVIRLLWSTIISMTCAIAVL